MSGSRALLLSIVASTVLAAPATAWSAEPASGEAGLDKTIGPLSMVAVKRDGAPVGGDAIEPSISADGRYVTYTSRSLAVVGLPDTRATQVLRYDRKTGRTVLVSATPAGAPGALYSANSTVSADGSVVVFETESGDLLPGAPNLRHTNVIVTRDLSADRTTLVSQAPGGAIPNSSSYNPLITADGSLVSFRTFATDITGTPGAVVFDRDIGRSSAVTVDTTGGPLTLYEAFISGDGQWLAFASTDPDIVAGDDNATVDTFLLNRATGDATLVSRSADGAVADAASQLINTIDSWSSPHPFTSADGSKVVFLSKATDLAGAEDPSQGFYSQAYVFDVASGLSELLTVLPDGSPAEDSLSAVTISPNGRYVAIETQEFLTGGTGVLGPKIFVRDLERQRTRAASNNQWSVGPSLGGGRPHVVFTTYSRLVRDDTDSDYDVYHRRVW